ncbi:hypothetical protein FOA52_004454 [Chlamydomonas sp. UWO 241]|nr:hypothetical protein FOA52_004454 [Chlamydomonas sp. UWO 241]
MRCFNVRKSEPWNFNFYLFPVWLIGVFFRYCIAFPLRLCVAVLGNCACIAVIMVVKTVMPVSKTRKYVEMRLAQVI